LVARGWTRHRIQWSAKRRQWQTVHEGVYALTQAPLTRRQRWIAAALSAPGTYLTRPSAGACWGFRPWEDDFETVVRLGSGGPERIGDLVVFRSKTLIGDVGALDGIPITTAPRTVIDLAPDLSHTAVGKMFRESLRLRTTTTRDLAATLRRHRGRRGTRLLWELTERYASLPYSRCRSDAEARALEILHDAYISPDRVNRHIAGEEADLIWDRGRRIIEIDGPQYHQFADEDLRKQARWERAGYTVGRIPSTDVFENPDALIELASR
jgi:very-short-patch-repair endonuclease